MATLSPFIKTASSSSSMIVNHRGTITKTSPSGRLSLLSSDIEEDLGILDLNAPEFKYICRQEYWLLNDKEYNPETNFSYDIVLEWINGYIQIKSDDEYKKYFHVSIDSNSNLHHFRQNSALSSSDSSRSHLTPINGYNRFDYLTKSSSVSRTATITKRKIENNNFNDNQFNTPTNSSSMNNDNTVRYGTITKGTISRPFLNNNNNNNRELNRTFGLIESKLKFTESSTETSSDSNGQIITSNVSTTPTMIDNHLPINTNTITKTNRRILNVTLDIVGRNHSNIQQRLECDPGNTSTSETDNSSDLNQANNLMITSDDLVEEFGLSSDNGLTDNNDLKRPTLNRTFEMNTEQSNLIEDSNDENYRNIVDSYNQTSDTSDRNFPTISRNNTRTLLLRREASQGQINNNKMNNINDRTISKSRQSMKQVNLVSSNDDLLNSDCSTLSLRSSTMSGGRSEPNLLDAQKRTTNGSAPLSVHSIKSKPRLSQIQVINAPKFQSRLMGPTGIAIPATNGSRISRIARPTANGVSSQPSLVNIRSSGIPGNGTTAIRSTNSFGSMGSIRDQQLLQNHHFQQQSNPFQMPRAVSQIVMNNDDDGQQQQQQQQQDLNGNDVQQQRLGMGLDRKSTFRVTNRPSSSSSSVTLMTITTMFDGQQYSNQKPVRNHQQTNNHCNSNLNVNHFLNASSGNQNQREVDNNVNHHHRSSSPLLSRNSKSSHSKQSSIIVSESTIPHRSSFIFSEGSNHNNNHICSDHTNNNDINNGDKNIVTSSRIPGLMKNPLSSSSTFNNGNNFVITAPTMANRLSIPVYGNSKEPLQRPNLINNFEQMPNQIIDNRTFNNCMESTHVLVTPMVNTGKSINPCQQPQQQQLNRTIFTTTAHHQPPRGFKINSCNGLEDNSWQDDCY